MPKSLYDYCVEHDQLELLRQWDKIPNRDLTPQDIMPGSHQKVWWRCAKGHSWMAEVKTRVRGAKCPVCSNRRVVAGENDLATTHPALAAQWHPAKNGALTPQKIHAGSYQKVWWQCAKGHEWEASVLPRASRGTGCPVCAGRLIIPGVNDLASSYPALAAQWHSEKNGGLTPNCVACFSNRKVWWLCERGHAYSATVAHRVQDASACPYCNNRLVLAGFNDLQTVAPEIAAQWHETLNGTMTPQMVTAGSRKKVWWQCPDGHVWKAVIYSRTGAQSCGCPVCAGMVKF